MVRGLEEVGRADQRAINEQLVYHGPNFTRHWQYTLPFAFVRNRGPSPAFLRSERLTKVQRSSGRVVTIFTQERPGLSARPTGLSVAAVARCSRLPLPAFLASPPGMLRCLTPCSLSPNVGGDR
jgi:hypothetical protein